MDFLQKLKLMIWFFFNKHKVHEYLEFANSKITIYNKIAFVEEMQSLYLVVLTSEGELLGHTAIDDLEGAKQFWSEQMKVHYNDFYIGGYDIVNIMPDDVVPEGFAAAANILKANHPNGYCTK